MIDDIENFEKNRQKFVNDSKICSIIREDLLDDFIQYVHQNSISLFSQIQRSIFETNSMLIEKEPTLIEYAAFYGSIRIIKYLAINKVEMGSSIWLYAVHSNNPEAISFLEEKNIEMDDRTFSESIKCHHNSISRYICENYFDNSTDLNEKNLLSIYLSSNYEFFSYEIEKNEIFLNLCMSEHYELVNLYLTIKNDEIQDYISNRKSLELKQLIQKALEENKIDVAYHLLLSMDSIPCLYFRNDKNVKKNSFTTIYKINWKICILWMFIIRRNFNSIISNYN